MLNICKLYELMDEKGVKSIKSLSFNTKIPYNTLMYMINGHDMYVSTLVELSKYFNVPIDYLISKSYGIEVVDDESSEFLPLSSILEATLIKMI